MDLNNIRPVLLGADMNCYNVARAFHEEYGVVSYAFGRYAIGVTQNSKIIRFTECPELEDKEKLIKLLVDFAKDSPEKVNILIGCTDAYVELIAECADRLADFYIIPYADFSMIKKVTSKADFYGLCDKYKIQYPKTAVVTSENYADFVSPFEYPIIIKPSVSAEYWKHPFDGMKKVYRAQNAGETKKILSDIYKSGYPEKVIIQDMIPGNDDAMYVLTAYSDKNAKVRMMCLGHVLLEEHTPKGLGNHAAIITAYKPELCEKFKELIEGEGFVGYANFDIKYDRRDGTYRAFEINTRQGRSNYYVTAAGYNIARNIITDRVACLPYAGCEICKNEIYWRYIPDHVVKKYVPADDYKKVKSIKKDGKAYSSFRYPYDLKNNPKRVFYIIAHELRQIKKFDKYYKPEIEAREKL
ncbi:MAG: hypothetical protein PUE85_09800 [Firmicutes bacterium]|nr:hypothetical protein [Bacillota bacterium]